MPRFGFLFWMGVGLCPGTVVPGQETGEGLGERLRSPDPAERARALEELRAAGATAVPLALRLLEGEEGNLRERVESLVQRLSSERWEERDGACRDLVRLGRRVRPWLWEAAERRSDPEVVWRIRDVLAGLSEGEKFEEERERFRTVALCLFLGESGEGRAVRPLLGVLARGGPGVREAAAEALGRLRDRMDPGQVAEAAGRILEIFGDIRNPPGGAEKARLLRVLRDLRSPLVSRPLAALVADPAERDVHLKRLAMGVLAALGDAGSLRVLVEALESGEVYVRQAAGALLREVSGEEWGIDPMEPPEGGREGIRRARAWWSRKFGEPWGE